MAKNNEEMTLLEPSSRISAEQAGYMELPGARKDVDCRKVEVEGGVSSSRGCCNIFELRRGAVKVFSCGTCEYVTRQGNKASAKG